MNSPKNKRIWLLPSLLIALSVIPLGAGLVRLAMLLRGGPVRPENARFFAAPLPVVLHVSAAIPFALLGALQLVPELRRASPRWHRRAGRLLAACGALVALSGLWMSLFYPTAEGDGPLLTVFRLGFGGLMLLSVGLGVAAARRRDFAQHGLWMTRAYAIGLGAGTQALLHVPWLTLVGKPSVLEHALLMAAGWLINLGVVEWNRVRVAAKPAHSSDGLIPN